MEGQHQWSQHWYLAEAKLHLYWLLCRWGRKKAVPQSVLFPLDEHPRCSAAWLIPGKGRGEWPKPCLTASGNRRPSCHLVASVCTSVGMVRAVVVSSLHPATSSVVTAAQTSAWVWTWLSGPPAAYPETLAFLEACASHQLVLSTKVCRGVSIFRMPLPPLLILKPIDSEWDAVSPPIIKASSDSCSERVPAAAELPEFLGGILLPTWAVVMLT